MGRALPALAVSAALLGSGCGTVNNLARIAPLSKDKPRGDESFVYGGVNDDWSKLNGMRWNGQSAWLNIVRFPLLVLDLPLSAIGDTATLPITMLGQVSRSINDYYFPPNDPPAAADDSHRM